jgi:hypothetical protein
MFLNTVFFYITYLVGITASIMSYNIVFNDSSEDPVETFETIPEQFSDIHSLSDFSKKVGSVFSVYGTVILFTFSSLLNITYLLVKKFTSKKKYVFNVHTKKWEYTTAMDRHDHFFEEDLNHSRVAINNLELKEIKLNPLTPKLPSLKSKLKNRISVFYFVSRDNMSQFDNLITNLNEIKINSSIEILPRVIVYNEPVIHLDSEATFYSLVPFYKNVYIAKKDYRDIDVYYTNIYNPTKIKNCILSAYSKLIKFPNIINNNNSNNNSNNNNSNNLLVSIHENLSNYFVEELKTSKTEFISFIHGLPLVDENTFSNAVNTCVNDGVSFVATRNMIRPNIHAINKVPTTSELSENSLNIPWYKRLFYSMESIEYDVNYIGNQGTELIRGFMFQLPPYTVWRLYDMLEFKFRDIHNNNCNIINEEDINFVYKNINVIFYDELDMIYQGILSGMKNSYEQQSRFYTLSSRGIVDWIKKHYACCCIWVQSLKMYLLEALNCCSKVSLSHRIMYFMSILYFEILYYISSQALPIIGMSIYYQLFNSNLSMVFVVALSYSVLPIQLSVIYLINSLDDEIKQVKSYHQKQSILGNMLYTVLFPFYNQIQFLVIIWGHIRMILNY